jgi:hypothetical protein
MPMGKILRNQFVINSPVCMTSGEPPATCNCATHTWHRHNLRRNRKPVQNEPDEDEDAELDDDDDDDDAEENARTRNKGATLNRGRRGEALS